MELLSSCRLIKFEMVGIPQSERKWERVGG